MVIYEFELQYFKQNDQYSYPGNPLYSELPRVAYEWVANSLSVYPNYLSRSKKWQETLTKKIKTLIKEETPAPIFADYLETLSPEQIAAEHIFWNWIFKRLEMKGGGTRDRQIFIALSEGYTLKEISKNFSISISRVTQILKKVIRIVQDELREMSKTERKEFEAELERLKSINNMGKRKRWDSLRYPKFKDRRVGSDK